MTKDKQLQLMKKNLSQLKAQRDRVISRAIQNPDGFEARAKDVLVRKYVGQIKALEGRMSALRKK